MSVCLIYYYIRFFREMEEIVVLSSDSSCPPSPEPIKTIDYVNDSLENHSICENDVNSSVSMYKRPANHSFSSSDESDNSLPLPPSFDVKSENKQSLESDSSDISIFYEKISFVSQTNDECSSTDVISNSREIDIKTNDVNINDNNCYLKMTGISNLNAEETTGERKSCTKLFEEEEKMLLEHSKEEDVNSSLSMRKRPASHPFSSSDESDDSIPIPPSYAVAQTKKQNSISDTSDINLHCGELRNFPQNCDISSSAKNVNNKKTNGTKKSCRKLTAEERKKMKLEQAREKALKKASTLALKNKKSGECLKNIQVVLDQRLLKEEYGGEILLSLKNSNMQYEIQEQLVPKSVTWTKFVNNYHVDDEMEIVTTTSSKEECNILIIMSAHEIVDLVYQNRLRNYIKDITSMLANKRINVVIYKLSEYYRLQNLHNQRKFKAHCRGQPSNIPNNEEYKVSRDDIEKALIEIQIFEDCCHKFAETPPELGSLIAHFTKATAEKDFKLEKRMAQDTERIYMDGKAPKKIKVDKNFNGLFNLWKRHICQFNNVNIDIAEAIVSSYPSPSSLILAYDNCSRVDGQKLIQDMRIRRAAGPLSSARFVGPAVSNSVYNCFSSLDGASDFV